MPVHRAMADALDRCVERDPRDPAARPHDRRHDPPDLADDRAEDPQGVDRPEGRRRPAGRGDVPRAPGAAAATRARTPSTCKQLEAWLRSYRPAGTVRRGRRPAPELAALAPKGDRRMGANPKPTAACCSGTCDCPTSATTPWRSKPPAASTAEDTRVLGEFLRDVIKANPTTNFRIFGPDETASNRLGAVFEATDRQWEAETVDTDDHLAPEGRVMEVLSEHQCEGWLEGYLLTGRHGLFNSYEAFIHIVDSMFNQHAKWLKVTQPPAVAADDRVAELPARLPRLAAGPQRVHPPGPRVHRPRREQEGRGHPRLPAAGRQLPAVGDGPLPAQPPLRERGRGRQAPRAAVADDGRGRQALHGRHRHLGVGQQRQGRRAGRRDGLRRRRADAGDPGGRHDPPPLAAGAEGPGGQRRRPDEAAAGQRTPARPDPTATSTCCSRRTSRSSSPTTATPG